MSTISMHCSAPNHKRCDASKITPAPREKSYAQKPRPAEGEGDAGGMQEPEIIGPPRQGRWRPSLSLTKKQRARIIAKSYGQCVYCGLDEQWPGLKIQIDHFVPYSRGGLHRMSNLVASCHRCNSAKSDMLVEEYRHYIMALHGEPFWLFDFENSPYGITAGLITQEEQDRLIAEWQLRVPPIYVRGRAA